MSYFLEQIPKTFFYLSNIKEIDEVKYPHHNPKFNIYRLTLERYIFNNSVFH